MREYIKAIKGGKMIKKKYLSIKDIKRLYKELELIPITYDYIFKGIFTEDLELLKEFILLLIDLNVSPNECKIRLLNNELVKENKKEYKKTVDIYVSIDNRVFVEIEVNREPFKDVKMRNYMIIRLCDG